MAIDSAEYKVIDPDARGPEAVERAFENQVAYCRDNGAPVTASVCDALRRLIDTDRGGAVMLRVRKWAGPALSDALPLRVAGALHSLYLSNEEPALAPIYEGLAPRDIEDILADTLERHEHTLLPWLDGPPQTNEAGRSANFAAALLWLAEQGLSSDFALYEFGSSAGINLMMRRYFYDLGGVQLGPQSSSMRLEPEWRGNPAPQGGFDIVAAQGCDIAPIDLTDPTQALRLKAYIWPEFTERFARMDAAIAAAERFPPEIERKRAADFVAETLARPAEPGVTRVIMHSVVWQYLPEVERETITGLIEKAGAQAQADSPLAWLSLEADRDTHRHELTVCHWPGGEDRRHLASSHPHGQWIKWRG